MTELLNIPHEPQIERAVIGALLMEPGYLPEVVAILGGDCFYDTINRDIFGAIMSLFDEGSKIDLITVSQRCSGFKSFGDVKPSSVLASYTLSVGSGSNVGAHARILREKQLARQMIDLSSRTLAAINAGGDIGEVIDRFNAGMDGISMILSGGQGARPVGEILKRSLQEAERRQSMAASGQTPGIPTGLTLLDELTTGWHGGELIILAARPGMGKTAFMLHSAKAAARAGYPACVYSLEMSATSIADRLLMSTCDVDPTDYRSGKINAECWRELERGASELEKLPIYIDDKPVVSMRYIRSHAQVMKKRGDCAVIFIDYLQLADTSSDQRNRNREQEIAQASRQAKILAKELDVPVVLLSQLSRRCEERADAGKMPMLSDLRESGAIEQDADVVGFLFRPAYYHIEAWPTSRGDVSTEGFGVLNIAKQRNGPTEEVAFRHNYSMTKITDYKLYDNVPKRDIPF